MWNRDQKEKRRLRRTRVIRPRPEDISHTKDLEDSRTRIGDVRKGVPQISQVLDDDEDFHVRSS